jgi:hypothetical protein
MSGPSPSTPAAGPPAASSILPLVVLLLALPVVPMSLRLVNEVADTAGRNRSYLPSIENRPSRRAFNPGAIESLQYGDPEWVFIGDSMLGTRIDPQLLGELAGRGDRNVMFLFQAASGPAWWYLSFKNHLVASGVKPRATFFFFRDTNLTDTTFRLRNHLGEALDEVAHETEPELDAIVAARERGLWWRLDAAFDRLYEVNATYAWLHPTIRRWYALWKYPDPLARLNFENVIEEDFNSNFRRDLAADIGAVEDDADFKRDLPTSVLPLIVGLSKAHGLPVCFVRVQRRPVGNQPPPQSPALRRYVEDFKAWAASEGACFHDDTGDPEITLDLYGDGDHVGDRLRYTRIFRKRLDPLLR